MRKIVVTAKHPWNWKVYLVLVGLIVPAAFAIIPFSVHQLNAYSVTDAVTPEWQVWVVNALIYALIINLLGGIGLIIANRSGLADHRDIVILEQ